MTENITRKETHKSQNPYKSCEDCPSPIAPLVILAASLNGNCLVLPSSRGDPLVIQWVRMAVLRGCFGVFGGAGDSCGSAFIGL